MSISELLEVRQLDERRCRRPARADGDERAAGEQRRLEAAPAPDEEGGQRGGDDEPDGLHARRRPTGATAIGRGVAVAERAAAAARAASRSANRPTRSAPSRRPARARRRRRARRRARRRSPGTATRAAGSRSLTSSSSGRSAARGARPSRSARGEVGRVARRGPAGRPRGRRRRSTSRCARRAGRARRRRRRAGSGVSALAGAGGQVARAGAPAPGRRRRARRAISRSSASSSMPGGARREPQRGAGVGRAAGHPGRDRDPLVDRAAAPAAPSQPVARAEARAARRRRGCSPVDARGRRPRRAPAPSGAGSSATRRRASIGWMTRHELVAAVARAPGPRNRQRLTFAGRRARAGARRSPQRLRRARGSPRARAARRARRPGGRARRAPRARGRARPGRAPGASASERASALRRWAKAACTSARSAGGGAGAGALEHDEHRVDVRHRVEDRARDRAVHAHVAGELGEHLTARRRPPCPGAAAKRSPTSRWTIATQRVTPSSSSIVRRIAPAAMP